jgi:hypothetical protein
MAVGSLIMGTLVIVDKLRYPDLPVAGWPSVITAVFFAAGMTNIMLGLVGAYLGELFNWSKGRPRYVIGQETPQSISPSTDLREIQRDRQDIVAQRN